MPAGRPLKYPTPELLQDAVDAYFDGLDNKPPTVSGLAYHLDVDTQTLRNYEERDQYFATIKRAKQRIEQALESGLWGNNVTGLIFNLKNNFGWKDRQEHELTSPDGTMRPTVIQLVAPNASNGSDTTST